jgi:hypothetical protein
MRSISRKPRPHRADSCAPVVKSPIWVSRIVNSNPAARLVPGAR